MAFDFRSKLRVSEHSHIAIETADFQLSQADGKAIKLSSLNGEAPISSARELILSGGPYARSEEAKAAGILWRRNLSIAFAQERVGIDFGQKSPEDSVRVSPHGSLTFDPDLPEYKIPVQNPRRSPAPAKRRGKTAGQSVSPVEYKTEYRRIHGRDKFAVHQSACGLKDRMKPSDSRSGESREPVHEYPGPNPDLFAKSAGTGHYDPDPEPGEDLADYWQRVDPQDHHLPPSQRLDYEGEYQYPMIPPEHRAQPDEPSWQDHVNADALHQEEQNFGPHQPEHPDHLGAYEKHSTNVVTWPPSGVSLPGSHHHWNSEHDLGMDWPRQGPLPRPEGEPVYPKDEPVHGRPDKGPRETFFDEPEGVDSDDPLGQHGHYWEHAAALSEEEEQHQLDELNKWTRGKHKKVPWSGLNQLERNIAEFSDHPEFSFDDPSFKRGTWERPAGLSDKYADVHEAADHFNDPVQRFRDDPYGAIQRHGSIDISAGLDPETGDWMNLVEADKQIRTAAWTDVAQKAYRLKREGAVHVKDMSQDHIYANVDGSMPTWMAITAAMK